MERGTLISETCVGDETKTNENEKKQYDFFFSNLSQNRKKDEEKKMYGDTSSEIAGKVVQARLAHEFGQELIKGRAG